MHDIVHVTGAGKYASQLLKAVCQGLCPWGLRGINKASSEAATGPGILEQNTERRKGAYAPGGYGGGKIAAGSFTGTCRQPIFM